MVSGDGSRLNKVGMMRLHAVLHTRVFLNPNLLPSTFLVGIQKKLLLLCLISVWQHPCLLLCIVCLSLTISSFRQISICFTNQTSLRVSSLSRETSLRMPMDHSASRRDLTSLCYVQDDQTYLESKSLRSPKLPDDKYFHTRQNSS